MRTNASLTIYNRYVLPNRVEAYARTVIPAVAWEDRKAVNTNASGGRIVADQARIYIPKAANQLSYLLPVAWLALAVKTGKWTVQVEDIVVRGTITDDLNSMTLTALEAKYDNVLEVSSVDLYDNGSLNLHHWLVSAK